MTQQKGQKKFFRTRKNFDPREEKSDQQETYSTTREKILTQEIESRPTRKKFRPMRKNNFDTHNIRFDPREKN